MERPSSNIVTIPHIVASTNGDCYPLHFERLLDAIRLREIDRVILVPPHFSAFPPSIYSAIRSAFVESILIVPSAKPAKFISGDTTDLTDISGPVLATVSNVGNIPQEHDYTVVSCGFTNNDNGYPMLMFNVRLPVGNAYTIYAPYRMIDRDEEVFDGDFVLGCILVRQNSKEILTTIHDLITRSTELDYKVVRTPRDCEIIILGMEDMSITFKDHALVKNANYVGNATVTVHLKLKELVKSMCRNAFISQ